MQWRNQTPSNQVVLHILRGKLYLTSLQAHTLAVWEAWGYNEDLILIWFLQRKMKEYPTPLWLINNQIKAQICLNGENCY